MAAPAERHADAVKALAALMDADSLLMGVALTPAFSGSVRVGDLRPIVEALHENLPSLKRVVEEYDAEKAQVADDAYQHGYADGCKVQAKRRAEEAVLVAADRVREAYEAMMEGRDIGHLAEWERS
jgi:hypothetical protein